VKFEQKNQNIKKDFWECFGQLIGGLIDDLVKMLDSVKRDLTDSEFWTDFKTNI
jgi:hypothetical protein